MDSMIAKLRVALQLDSAAFESGTTRAANQVNALGINMASAQARMANFSEGLILSSNAAQRAGQSMRAVNDNAGQMRAGLQSAGFQLQDMAVQFASGQRAGVIFAQQLPQLSGALSQMAAAAGTTSGVFGRLAGFMAGPWGVAVGVGVAVLSPLIAKLFETGKAADDATAKVSNLKNALAGIKANPMQTLGAINLEIVQAQAKLRQAEAMPRFTGGGSEAYKAGTFVERQRAKAIADAKFALQEAQTTYNVANQVYQNTQKLAVQADKIIAAPLGSGGGSGGGARRSVGQTATGSVINDELRRLQQTTNDILASFKPFGDAASGQFSGRADKKIEALRGELGDVNIAMEKYGIEVTETNAAVGQSFQQMANDSLNSLRQLTNGIQSGDFLGILGGLINTLSDLGGMGLFGKGVQASVAAFRAQPRANGGPVSANQLYMVGERGPELFVPNGGGSIVPNHKLSGGGSMQVQVVPSPYFDVRVLQNVGTVAPMIANAGADLGNSRMAKAGRRRLG